MRNIGIFCKIALIRVRSYVIVQTINCEKMNESDLGRNFQYYYGSGMVSSKLLAFMDFIQAESIRLSYEEMRSSTFPFRLTEKGKPGLPKSQAKPGVPKSQSSRKCRSLSDEAFIKCNTKGAKVCFGFMLSS